MNYKNFLGQKQSIFYTEEYKKIMINKTTI